MKSVRNASLLLFFVSATALAQFEGVAELKMTMSYARGEPVARGTFSISKSAARSDWEVDLRGAADAEAKKSGIPDRYKMTTIVKLSDPDKVYMLNDERKTYSVLDLKAMRESVGGEDESRKFTVKKLGRRDTVAGLSCEVVQVTSSSGTGSELCMTRELAVSKDWLAAMNRDRRGGGGPFARGLGGPFAALRAQGIEGFPIRMITRESSDKRVSSTMELVRVERKSLPGSLFEVPAGYRETSGMGVMMTPEQEKAMKDALEKMTPEQRKMYEEMMKKQQRKEKDEF